MDEQALLEYYPWSSDELINKLLPPWLTSFSKMSVMADGSEPDEAAPYWDAYIQHSVDLAIEARAAIEEGEQRLATNSICCVGCNAGCAVILSKRSFPKAEVLGVEFVPSFVEVAHTRFEPTEDMKVVQGNLLHLAEVVPHKYDIIIDEVVVSHMRGEVEELTQAAQALKASLNPLGVAVTCGLCRVPTDLTQLKDVMAANGMKVTLTKGITDQCVQGGVLGLARFEKEKVHYPLVFNRVTQNYEKLLRKVQEQDGWQVMVICIEHARVNG